MLLYACLPSDIVEKILCIPISLCNHEDQLILKHIPNGAFSVKSAYLSTFDLCSSLSGKWGLIWNLQVPPKLKIFTWLFVQSKLLTNVNRFSRHITSDPYCKHCPGHPETMLHLSRDCPRISLLWPAIGGPPTIRRTFSLDWEAWIAANAESNSCPNLCLNA